MKLLSIAFLFAFVMPVHAAYVSLSCSNATGTVIWEEGANSNMVHLTYNGFVTGVLELERSKVHVEIKEEVSLREQLLSQCGGSSSMLTSASRVVITPDADHPDALQSYFPQSKIEADVICEKIVSNQVNCRP